MYSSKNTSGSFALVIGNMIPVGDTPFLPVKNIKTVSFHVLHFAAVNGKGGYNGNSLFFQEGLNFFRPVIVIPHIGSSHDFGI